MDKFFTLYCIIIALAFAAGAGICLNGQFSFWRGVGFAFCLVGLVVYIYFARLCSHETPLNKPFEMS